MIVSISLLKSASKTVESVCKIAVLSRILKIMIERGYARELRGCFAEFEKLYYERHGILKAYVQSAVSLTDEQCEALREKLQSYSKKSVELSTKVVPSLIGGIRVELDGKLLEGSVRAGLDRLRSDIDKTIL